MKTYKSDIFIRVNKSIARKLYILGFDVGLCPHKANPESPWGLLARFNRHNCIADFDKMVDVFARFNCNKELGQYPAFYVDKNTYIHFEFKDGSNPYYFRGSSVDCLR